MLENKFSLIDEPWIPVVDRGLVSLKQIFTHSEYRQLGGNPIQKIALLKLLLAIAQAAYTPEDENDWADLVANGLSDKCLSYLNKWYDCFDLFGDKPFLQMPQISMSKKQSFGAVSAEIATGNTTILNAIQLENDLTNADKALLILTLNGFSLGGKKTDNSIVLSIGYMGKSNAKGKPSTGKPGASLGFMGFLHNFLLGETIQKTLWLNLLSKEQINNIGIYPQGVGNPPWEENLQGEDCHIAKKLRESLIGRMLPMSRFCLLDGQQIHYSEGVAHLDYKSGVVDPSVAVDFSKKDAKVLWVDTDRRPWRFLTALLSFMDANTGSFNCIYIKYGLLRSRKHSHQVGIWSGGLRVSNNAGEQYVSGSNDYVESSIFMETEYLGKPWYEQLKLEMSELDHLGKIVYGSTLGYYKNQQTEGKSQAANASNLFWQLCEQQFQNLVNSCDDYKKTMHLRKIFAQFIHKSYDTYCHKDTARQLESWAKNRPNLNKYLKETYNKKEDQV